MEKCKTIADVFIHNFETLNKWRELINVPHRLPEAVKYFVAQQLSDDEAIAGLMLEQPEHRVWDILAFVDHSVLVPPDEIYEDEATYNHIVSGTEVLEQIASVEKNLDLLPKITSAIAFLDKAHEVLKALGVLRVKNSNFVATTITELANELDAALFKKYPNSPGQQKFVLKLRAVLKEAEASGVWLRQCSKLVTQLPQTRKSKRREASPRAPRSRRSGVASKRTVGMQNSSPKIQFWFDREQHVIPCEFSGLIEAYKPQFMSPLGVRQHCGSVQILFSGYRSETRLPFVIPEVRRFLRRLRQEWLFAPFFCDLENCFVSLEAIAHVENFAVIEQNGSDEFHLQINTAELRRYGAR